MRVLRPRLPDVGRRQEARRALPLGRRRRRRRRAGGRAPLPVLAVPVRGAHADRPEEARRDRAQQAAPLRALRLHDELGGRVRAAPRLPQVRRGGRGWSGGGVVGLDLLSVVLPLARFRRPVFIYFKISTSYPFQVTCH